MGYAHGPSVPVYSQHDMDDAVAEMALDLSDAYQALEFYENLLDSHGIET
jgi:hypothetical protein